MKVSIRTKMAQAARDAGASESSASKIADAIWFRRQMKNIRPAWAKDAAFDAALSVWADAQHRAMMAIEAASSDTYDEGNILNDLFNLMTGRRMRDDYRQTPTGESFHQSFQKLIVDLEDIGF